MCKEMINNVVSGGHAPGCSAFNSIDHHRCWDRLIRFWHVKVYGDVVKYAACHSNFTHLGRTKADLVIMKQYIYQTSLILLTFYKRPYFANILTKMQSNLQVKLIKIALIIDIQIFHYHAYK